MRTSLNEIKLIDGHIFNNNPPGDALLFDALLILNPGLSANSQWQKNAHALVRQYSRKKLKAEIEMAHNQLFTRPEHDNFRQRILSFFNKK